MGKQPGFDASLALVGSRLHGIGSRTDPAKIAAEVVRINDAVRDAARGRVHSGNHPQDFGAMLLTEADPSNDASIAGSEASRQLSARQGAIAETGARLRRGELSSLELTRAALARAAALQPSLNAFIELRAEAAFDRARALDLEAESGRWRGPLHGIPLAHKDCFERGVAGMTVGSAVVRDEPPRRATATVLKRLEAAGAVDLGALNLNEMVAGPTGQNPHFGDCRNSVDPARIAGGSSSGSGSAVGAGIVAASLGSDTGGSIRIPASVNGLLGLKPTYGRVSRAGCFPRAFSLDCVGPIARTAQDCAILLQVIAGVDDDDPSSLDAPVPDYLACLNGAADRSRIGVFEATDPIDAQIGEAFKRLIDAASDRYGGFSSARFDALDGCYVMADILSKVEAATVHGRWMREQPHHYSQAVFSRTEPGLHLPAVRYVEALNVRATLLREFLHGPMASIDVLMCPTLPVPVPTIVEADMEAPGRVFGVVAQLTRLTRPFNYLGLPVLSIPIGRDSNGLPIGAQLVGRPFGEARLLSMAAMLMGDVGWA